MKIEPSELQEFKQDSFSMFATEFKEELIQLGINGNGEYEVRNGVARSIHKTPKEAVERFCKLTGHKDDITSSMPSPMHIVHPETWEQYGKEERYSATMNRHSIHFTRFLSPTNIGRLIKKVEQRDDQATSFLVDEIDRLQSRIKTIEMHLTNLVNASQEDPGRNISILLTEFLNNQ